MDPMWPHKYEPKKKVQLPTMKQGLSHIYYEYQHGYQNSNNYLSGDQSLQVLNYLLVTSTQTKWNLSIGIPAQPKDFPIQVDTWTTYVYILYIHVDPEAS